MTPTQAEIIREWDSPEYEAPGKPRIYRYVLYRIGPHPPRQIRIPADLATDAAVAAAIAADHAEALAHPPGRMITLPPA